MHSNGWYLRATQGLFRPMTETKPSPIPHLLMAGFLLLCLGWVYGAAVLDHGYVYDDYTLIETNPSVLTLWGPLQNWSDPLWAFDPRVEARATGFWRPFTLQVLAAARWISDGEAWGPHLVSLLVHGLACFAAVRLMLRLGASFWLAWGVAFVFALHPVQVQAVAWAACINDPLIGLFALVALRAFLDWVDLRRIRSLIVAMGALALGLLSKEQAAGIVPIAGLMLWWLRGQRFLSAARAVLPLAGVLLAYYLVRVSVFDSWGAGLSGAIVDFGLSPGREWTFRAELLGGFASLLLWPVDLAFFRGVRPEIPPGDSSYAVQLVLAGLWLASVFLAWARGRKRVAFWLALPIVWLGPQVWMFESAGAYPLSDRYLYVPVFAFAALVLSWLAKWLPERGALAAGVALALPMAWLGHGEVQAYQDNETFFRTAIAESPEVAVGHWSLGRVVFNQYKRDKDHAKLEEALVRYLSVLVLNRDYGDRAPKLGEGDPMRERAAELTNLVHGSPIRPPLGSYSIVSAEDLFQANMGQGWALLALGELPPQYDISAAIETFSQISQAYPYRYQAWIGLSSAHFSAGDLDQARSAIAKALEVNPKSADGWAFLGEIQRRQGKYLEAANSFREAQRFRPHSIRDTISRIKTLIDGGQVDVADHELTVLSDRYGKDPRILYLEGMLAGVRGQWEIALNQFDRVLAQEPDNADAHLQRGKVLTQLGRTTEAVAALGRTCELDSLNFEAHSLIGQILMADPASEAQAREYILRAYSLGTATPARRHLQIYLLQWIGNNPDTLMEYMHMDQARRDWKACLWWIEKLQGLQDPWAGRPDRMGRMAAVQLAAGSCLKELGEHEAAIAAWREGNELDDGLFWMHYNLGSLLFELGRFDEAIAPFEKAQTLIEQLPTKDNFRGAVQQALQGQLNNARLQGPEFMGPKPAPAGGSQSE